MTDEKIINALRQTNLLTGNDDYFMGVVMPSIGNQILLGNFAHFIKEFSGYIINQTQFGIGIIPMSNMTGQPMINLACFLPYNNIMTISIEKGGLFFFRKITITDINNQVLSFKVVKNVLTVKKHKENLEKFLTKYNGI